MLSAADSELITKCGPGTPMGTLMREYWIPAVQSVELPAPDCPPVRIKLLDEYLIAFRVTSGKVGLIEDACPHRGASMFFGRNEEEGLRCVYHGWKFDITGQCTDMMSEPVESNFREKVHTVAYPTRERGGIIWAYMGPRQVPPPLPDLEANMIVEGEPYIETTLNPYNWLQAIENNMDTSHNPILHFGAVTPETVGRTGGNDSRDGSEARRYMISDRSPRSSVRDTEFGFTYSCYRPAGDGKIYHRMMNFLFPFFTMTPVPRLGTAAMFVATVPIDDHHNMQWLTYRTSGGFTSPFGSSEPQSKTLLNTSDWLGRFRQALDPSKDFGIDRALQSARPPVLQGWTGLDSVNTQDEAMKWSQGRQTGGIVNRTREHLGTTDSAIIRVRRGLLDAAKALRDHGTPPPNLETPEVYRVRSGWAVLPSDVDWLEATRDLREGFRRELPIEATLTS
jgi:phthalate 4,5-dioxygenase oxygenase subunit